MDRVFESGAAGSPPSAPASPSSGYPTAGNPSLAVAATKPGPWWYHQITEELRGVIVAAGLTPNHADVTQLSSAIRRLITGGDFKDSVRVASTANIAALSGLLTIDGVVLIAGDRVLVKDQGAGADNGIYVAAAGAWARATDADTGAELSAGATIPVEAGTANADTLWMLTTDGTIVVGTTALVFAIKSGDASTTRKGQVQLATSAEAQALSDALKALTPSTLAAALQGANQSMAASGYQKLPGGLIIQWGVTAISSAGAAISTTYPIAFPTAVLSLQLLVGVSAGSYMAKAEASALSGFDSSVYNTSTTARVAGSTLWFLAIGK